MLSLQTLTNIEALLMSRSYPLWGEFMPLAQVINEVQQAKAALMQSRAQPAQPQPSPPQAPDVPALAQQVASVNGAGG
jgi:hypothetical protein